jgi:hypothetical protein
MMVEDAISGVTAGARGNFGLVLGIARDIDGLELTKVGADLVVTDLGDISVDDVFDWFESGIGADAWSLRFDTFDPQDEAARAALCTVGNGYLGVSGASELCRPDGVHAPGTQLAAAPGGAVLDWTRCELKIGRGEYVSPFRMQMVSYRQRLDMLDGTLTRTMVVRDKVGRLTRIESRRVASAAEVHVAALELSVTPLNYSGTICLRSGVDGTVGSAAPVAQGSTPGGLFVHLKTTGEHPVEVACAPAIACTRAAWWSRSSRAWRRRAACPGGVRGRGREAAPSRTRRSSGSSPPRTRTSPASSPRPGRRRAGATGSTTCSFSIRPCGARSGTGSTWASRAIASRSAWSAGDVPPPDRGGHARGAARGGVAGAGGARRPGAGARGLDGGAGRGLRRQAPAVGRRGGEDVGRAVGER